MRKILKGLMSVCIVVSIMGLVGCEDFKNDLKKDIAALSNNGTNHHTNPKKGSISTPKATLKTHQEMYDDGETVKESGLYLIVPQENGTTKTIKKEWKTYYPNGKLEKEEHFDEMGRRDGPYQEFRRDGTLKTDIFFENGEAKWFQRYFDNGQVGAEGGYSENGELYCRGYYEDGKLYIEASSKGKEKKINVEYVYRVGCDFGGTGTLKEYAKDGNIIVEVTYKNGELNGHYYYYFNHTPDDFYSYRFIEGEYDFGKKVGVWNNYKCDTKNVGYRGYISPLQSEVKYSLVGGYEYIKNCKLIKSKQY